MHQGASGVHERGDEPFLRLHQHVSTLPAGQCYGTPQTPVLVGMDERSSDASISSSVEEGSCMLTEANDGSETDTSDVDGISL